jgi:hypothetical protein
MRSSSSRGMTIRTGRCPRRIRRRSELDDVSADSSAAGVVSVAGSLATTNGESVGGAALSVLGMAQDGQRQMQSVVGEVPAGATSAVVVIRVNAENAGPGAADVRLYRVSYAEGGDNLVPDPQFADGGWTPYGAGSGTFPASDRGAGRMLQLTADPDQDLFVDSQPFDITEGVPFEFTVADSVPQGSVGSGFIAVVFLGSDDLEISRSVIPFEPVLSPLGDIETDASGGFAADLEGVEAGRYSIRVYYPGDAAHWPSWADTDAEVS